MRISDWSSDVCSSDLCRRGDELLCAAPRTLGVRYGGGYSDRVLAPHPRYLIDFDGVDEALACTYACSGVTAYSALKKAAAGLTAEDSLMVIGAGDRKSTRLNSSH